MAVTVRDAVEKLARIFAQQPEKARTKNAPATAVLDGGLKFQVMGPNGERLSSDMPPALGGGGSAPNPAWFLRASLASCNATVIAMRAAQIGVTLTSLEVSVTSESDTRGLLGSDDMRLGRALRLSNSRQDRGERRDGGSAEGDRAVGGRPLAGRLHHAPITDEPG